MVHYYTYELVYFAMLLRRNFSSISRVTSSVKTMAPPGLRLFLGLDPPVNPDISMFETKVLPLTSTLTSVRIIDGHPLFEVSKDIRTFFRRRNEAFEKTSLTENSALLVANALEALEALDISTYEGKVKARAFYVANTNAAAESSMIEDSKTKEGGETVAIMDGGNVEQGEIVLDLETIQLLAETELRVKLLHKYLVDLLPVFRKDETLSRTGDSKEAATTRFAGNLNEKAVLSLIDSFLLGTASERLVEHMKLYKSPFSPGSLQDCFYQIFEAEISVVSNIFLTFDTFEGKKNNKKAKAFKKWMDTYLLDGLELNMKSRCVIAWAEGDNHQHRPGTEDAFRVMKETDTVTQMEAIVSRKKYFPEGLEISNHMVKKYVEELRKKDYDKGDFRKKAVQGLIFWIGICTIDGAIESR